jgi:hypothetical protein
VARLESTFRTAQRLLIEMRIPTASKFPSSQSNDRRVSSAENNSLSKFALTSGAIQTHAED